METYQLIVIAMLAIYKISITIYRNKELSNTKLYEVIIKEWIVDNVDYYMNKTLLIDKHLDLSKHVSDIAIHSRTILELCNSTITRYETTHLNKIISVEKQDAYLYKKIETILTERLAELKTSNLVKENTKIKKAYTSVVTKIKETEAGMGKKISMLNMENGALKEQMILTKTVDHDGTIKILDTMIARFIEDIFTNEIDRPHLAKQGARVTENHYRMVGDEEQGRHMRRIIELVKSSVSPEFMKRLSVFYTDEYMNNYIPKLIKEKYIQRYMVSYEKSAELSKTVRENLRVIQREREIHRMKKDIEEFKEINSHLNTFGHNPYLPETVEEYEGYNFENNKTHRFLKDRYVLNRFYHDDLSKTIKGTEDLVRDIDHYPHADDKLVSYLAEKLEWTKMKQDPETIENAKIDIVNIAFLQSKAFNPLEFFDEQYKRSPKSTEYFNGQKYDLSNKRLNDIFYDEKLYSEDYSFSNIQEALKFKNAISITV